MNPVSAALDSARIIPRRSRLLMPQDFDDRLGALREKSRPDFPISVEQIGWTLPCTGYPNGMPILDYIFGRLDNPFHRVYGYRIHADEPTADLCAEPRAGRRCADPGALLGVTDHHIAVRRSGALEQLWTAGPSGLGHAQPSAMQFFTGSVREFEPWRSVENSYPIAGHPDPREPSYGTAALMNLDALIQGSDGRIAYLEMGHDSNLVGTHVLLSGPQPQMEPLARELSALIHGSPFPLCPKPVELPREVYLDAPSVFQCSRYAYYREHAPEYRGGGATRDHFEKHHQGIVMMYPEISSLVATYDNPALTGITRRQAVELQTKLIGWQHGFARSHAMYTIKAYDEPLDELRDAAFTASPFGASGWGHELFGKDGLDYTWNADPDEFLDPYDASQEVITRAVTEARRSAILGRVAMRYDRHIGMNARSDAYRIGRRVQAFGKLRIAPPGLTAQYQYACSELAWARTAQLNGIVG